MSKQTLLDAGRLEILSADKKIAVCLKDNFQLVARQPEKIAKDFDLPDDVRNQLDEAFAPKELIETVLRFIDLSRLQEHQRTALSELTTYLIARYDGVLKVEQYKRDHPEKYADQNGKYESYDQTQHDGVKKRWKEMFSKQPEIGQDIGSDMADLFVIFQNKSLNGNIDFRAPADSYKKQSPIDFTRTRRMQATLGA